MIIVLINWRIIPERVEEFLVSWSTKFKLGSARGCIIEMLSRVESESIYENFTWELEEDVRDQELGWRADPYTSFVNVGLWTDFDSFQAAVGRNMSKGRSIGQEFEAAPRRRAFLTPDRWRRGDFQLPDETSP